MSDVAALTAERDALRQQLVAERVGHAFAGSKFITHRLTVPAAIMESGFGKHFEIEDGRIVAKDRQGNRIMSRERMGEPADFDEALEALVDSYEHKDRILKGSGASGGGAHESAAMGFIKTMPRVTFEGLSAAEQMQWVTRGGRVTD